MVGIVLDTVFPIERGSDWQIKIALFQSEKSFGYALIKGKELNDLPKGPDSINILARSYRQRFSPNALLMYSANVKDSENADR